MRARMFLLGAVALLLLVAGVLGVVGIRSRSPEVAPSEPEGLLGEPAPPFGEGPIEGDRVALSDAQARLPWAILLPSETAVDAQLTEVWVSPESWEPRERQVYLIYSNGIEISIWPQGLAPDYASAIEPPFRLVSVRSTFGLGKESGIQDIEGHGKHEYPASVTWWERGLVVNISSYSHSLDQLIAVAESIPRIEGARQRGGEGAPNTGLSASPLDT